MKHLFLHFTYPNIILDFGQLLINDRFTLLNRSFIENKGRSAVINVSRTSGRLYSFVMTTVQFIACYSQGTRPLLLLAEWVDGSSILQQGPPERIGVWASYLEDVCEASW